MKKIVFAVLLMVSLVSLLVIGNGLNLSDVTIAGDDWLNGWSYRRAHNITGSTAGSQTNYPMTLSVHWDNGVDNAGEVYLAGKCRTDFGDIRFTDSTGTNPLDYWIQQKIDGTLAMFWVEIGYIPPYPNATTIFMYYGNVNASTTSNKDWTLNLASDFEDGTKQGWTISWSTFTTSDDLDNTTSFQGNASRTASRTYGSAAAGTGELYDGFRNTVYLGTGSYRMEGAGKFFVHDRYFMPSELRLIVDGTTIALYDYPQTNWHFISGGFTVSIGHFAELFAQLHLYVSETLSSGDYRYNIDYLLVRKWCSPEPVHGVWETEEISSETVPPVILLVNWLPTAPFPFVPSLEPRQTEPVLARTNVSEETGGSGLNHVTLSYRVDSSPWSNTTMVFNSTTQLWEATIPGQIGNTTVEFVIVAYDNAGNIAASPPYSFNVEALPTADINGDGIVNMLDLYIAALHFSETAP